MIDTSFAEERRIRTDRRSAETPDWINGWLCFDCGEEKRRLTPLPDDWEVASWRELEAFREQAVLTRSNS